MSYLEAFGSYFLTGGSWRLFSIFGVALREPHIRGEVSWPLSCFVGAFQSYDVLVLLFSLSISTFTAWEVEEAWG